MLRSALLLSTLLIALLVSGCVSKNAYQLKSDEARNMEAMIADLEKDYEQAVEQQKVLAARYDELNSQLETVTGENETLRQE